MLDSVLFKASLKLTKAMDNVADENLPYKIADIVKVHTKGATIGALSGAIPGIGGVIAFLTGAGFIWGMYARINKALGIELSENIIKTLATGIIVNLGASIITPLVAGSVISFIPFAGNIGAIVIIGATVYGATMASGIIYLKIMTHIFEAGEDPSNLSVGALKSISKDIVSSFNADEFMKKAKEEFKQKKDSGEFEEEDDEYKFEDEDCDNDEEEDDDYNDDDEDNEDDDDDDDK